MTLDPAGPVRTGYTPRRDHCGTDHHGRCEHRPACFIETACENSRVGGDALGGLHEATDVVAGVQSTVALVSDRLGGYRERRRYARDVMWPAR